MPQSEIRFEDGAAYEQSMGKWSQLAGGVFLDWLAAPPALRWLDVGCGNGAFTELLIERCAPAQVQGIDPSEAQLAFARTRAGTGSANFQLGDAMALPFTPGAFDIAVMALVIFFVPEPPRAVAEMVRVVRPGGMIAAYAWDILGGGFTLEPLRVELRAMGINPVDPPSVQASRLEVMQQLWRDAGLEAIETRQITVQRSFSSFEEFWSMTLSGSASLRPILTNMSPAELELFKTRVGGQLRGDAVGRITCEARANAVKGRVP
jgi:ubiquinone/menaquinone biosynthesis C-methylase UbiE